MKIYFLTFTLLMAGLVTSAQSSDKNKYEAVDKYAEQLGPLPSLNIATIADTLTSPFSGKPEKARALYYWITHNIALDPKAMRSNDNSKYDDPVKIMELRKSTPAGFSLLFQEMASMANIRCLSVDGYTRNNYEQINEKPDELNHSWNVVQLGQTPTEWYYVDAAKGCGRLDNKQTNFIPEFTSEYFFTDKQIFNLDHFPDNSAWQLGPGAKSLSDFFAMPVYWNSACAIGLSAFQPLKGIMKIKNNTEVNFSLRISPSTPVTSLELYITEDRKKGKPIPMNFIFSDGELRFSYTFREADQFPLSIVINKKDILTYSLEVTE